MLKALKKTMGVGDTASLEQLAMLETKLQEKEVELANLFSVNKEQLEKIATFEQLAQGYKEQLDAVQSYVAEMNQKAKEAKLSARKQKIEMLVGEEKAESTFEATKDMEDSAFDAVCQAISTSLSVEEQSPQFQETGVKADSDVSGIEKSPEMALLEAKYKK